MSTSLESLELQLSGTEGFKNRPTLRSLVADWDTFVCEVESGDLLGEAEYKDDLSLRKWLLEAEALLPPESQQSLQQLLLPLDQRFRSATTKVAEPIHGSAEDYPLPSHWFQYRVPRKCKDAYLCHEFELTTGYRCELDENAQSTFMGRDIPLAVLGTFKKLSSLLVPQHGKNWDFTALVIGFGFWQHQVIQIEKGFVFYVSGYTDSLGFRDFFREVAEALPGSERAELLLQLRPLDDQFRAATVEVQNPVGGSPTQYPRDDAWFRYRVPRSSVKASACEDFENVTGYRCKLISSDGWWPRLLDRWRRWTR